MKTTLDLWPELPPGERVPGVDLSSAGEGAVRGIAVPQIDIDPPDDPCGTAVIVLGGGGYRHIQMARESEPAAQWLKTLGITPVILRYRLPSEGWAPDAPVQDLLRALRILRARAKDWSLDPSRIGVLGYSAGGHLGAMGATRFAHGFYTPMDDADALSPRPDFAALVFPVITLTAPYDTTRTKTILTGQSTDPAFLAPFEPHRHVDAQTPPMFLAHAADDPIAAPAHSIGMFGALNAANIPAELHIFESGGHGRAFGADGARLAEWAGLFSSWAERRGLLASTPRG